MSNAIIRIPLSEIAKVTKGFLLAASWGNAGEAIPEVWEWDIEAERKATEYVPGWLDRISIKEFRQAVSGTRALHCFTGDPIIALGGYLFWEMNGHSNHFRDEPGLARSGLADALQTAALYLGHCVTVYRRDDGKGTFA